MKHMQDKSLLVLLLYLVIFTDKHIKFKRMDTYKVCNSTGNLTHILLMVVWRKVFSTFKNQYLIMHLYGLSTRLFIV